MVAGKRQLMLSRWGTYAKAPFLSTPRTVSDPCATGSSPAMASKRVLLPAPFGPRMPINVPGPTSKVIPVSATCPPRSTDMSSTVMPRSEIVMAVPSFLSIRVQRLSAPGASRYYHTLLMPKQCHLRPSTIRPTFVRIISMYVEASLPLGLREPE